MNSNIISYVLDTSVIVEYIDEESPYRDKIENLFRRIATGKIRAYITTTTLSEVLYVATRIYQEASSPNPNEDALNFVKWLIKYPGVKIVNVDFRISLLAGELRKRMKISLIDCYVIATAKVLNARPLFLRLEREMKKYVDTLKL